MFLELKLFPDQASTMASQVDNLYFFLVGLSGFATLFISGLIVAFAIRYRKTAKVDRSNAPTHSMPLELFWSSVTLVIFMGIFFWSATIFFNLQRPPDDAMEVQVLGKRWMWKLQHPNGRREINELHVPVGQAVKLKMTSEDVIHSFYVPAFRIKADLLPGRYTSTWFEATKVGTYHLFCAEYCGTKHSQMLGSIVVMEPHDFQAWLGGDTGLPPAVAGEKLFTQMGCITCHNPEAKRRGPDLAGLFGTPVELQGGGTVIADENYLRESIVDPRAKMVTGYEALMPTFTGLLSEDAILQIIEYIKSIGPEDGAPAATGSSPEMPEETVS